MKIIFYVFLYAALQSTNQVSSFRIDQKSGKLSHIHTTNVIDNPVYIIPDRTNKYLLTAYYGANRVAIYPVIGDSIIEGNPVVNLSAGTNPHCIQTDPTNRFVFVPAKGSDEILLYHFNENNGKISENTPGNIPSEQGAGPRHLTFHPSKDIVYVVNENNSTVCTYGLDTTTGLLNEIHTITTLPQDYSGENTCADIHISPYGKWLYASNRGHNSIVAFSVQENTGALVSINWYSTEPVPREFAISSSGKYLYAGGESSGKIAAYEIQADGSLEKITTVTAGSSVTWIEVVGVYREIQK